MRQVADIGQVATSATRVAQRRFVSPSDLLVRDARPQNVVSAVDRPKKRTHLATQS
jgi:hypothetical protein